MAKRAIIRVGDLTSHGGQVVEGFETLTVYGKKAAGIGHHGFCPLCKRPFVIVGGAENFTYFGKNVALEGMYTSCGAQLIASQGEATVDDSAGSGGTASSATAQSASKRMLSRPDSMFNDKFQLRDEDDLPLANAEYTIFRADGSKESGKTDGSGHTHMIDDHKAAEIVAIHIGDFDD
ncbi:PAAR domain-containing protein [Paludibacterium purpuratum]|uniref:PAAR domain-containing protein n=1 Tax=Paludibacterium purpuratum TaxID=1144873 RepID=UPI00105F1A2B|nr:PAAR domain-containing protein [Paludibacterium purpuratum]